MQEMLDAAAEEAAAGQDEKEEHKSQAMEDDEQEDEAAAAPASARSTRSTRSSAKKQKSQGTSSAKSTGRSKAKTPASASSGAGTRSSGRRRSARLSAQSKASKSTAGHDDDGDRTAALSGLDANEINGGAEGDGDEQTADLGAFQDLLGRMQGAGNADNVEDQEREQGGASAGNASTPTPAPGSARSTRSSGKRRHVFRSRSKRRSSAASGRSGAADDTANDTADSSMVGGHGGDDGPTEENAATASITSMAGLEALLQQEGVDEAGAGASEGEGKDRSSKEGETDETGSPLIVVVGDEADEGQEEGAAGEEPRMVHDLSRRTSGASSATSAWSNGVKSRAGRRASSASSGAGAGGLGLDLGDSRVLGRPSVAQVDDVTAELDALRRTGRIPDKTQEIDRSLAALLADEGPEEMAERAGEQQNKQVEVSGSAAMDDDEDEDEDEDDVEDEEEIPGLDQDGIEGRPSLLAGDAVHSVRESLGSLDDLLG